MNITVVTGLFDIGRGGWSAYRRTNFEYVQYFANVLTLNLPMVIYTEEKFKDVVKSVRKNIDKQTTIVIYTLEDLFMNKYEELLYDIQNDPEYARGHENPYAPEVTEPLYALVTCSKPDLLRRGLKHAQTDHVVWLDGGYSHGNIPMRNIDWKPSFNPGKLKIIAIGDMSQVLDDPIEYTKLSIAVINGGFFGGSKETIINVVEKYYEVVDYQLTTLRLKQDDQVPWEYLVKDNPELFDVVQSGWYDAFTA